MQNIANLVVGYEWLWIIIIGVIVTIIILVAVRATRKPKVELGVEDLESDSEVKTQNEKALKILKQRLAKGEITKEEFEKLKKEFE